MRGLRFFDKFLENVNCIVMKNRGDNIRVVDYIWMEVKENYGFSGTSNESLKKELRFVGKG